MLGMRAVPSPDQGSHSFFQIENQPWGSRPLIESASDCCCSNYSCVVPLGPAARHCSDAGSAPSPGEGAGGGWRTQGAALALVSPPNPQVQITELLIWKPNRGPVGAYFSPSTQ